jgi:hypothetical protein
MLRAFALLIVLQGIAGCDEPRGAREVPISRQGAGRPTSNSPDPNVVTKEARAIATH